MSGLAKVLKFIGYKVSGSDVSYNANIQHLIADGIDISIGHQSDNINQNIDLVVHSGAIKDDNPEIIEANRLGIKIIERSELLGVIASRYERVIAISGTHGKTTTTAMIGEIFKCAGYNPTIHLGGVSVNLNTNTYIGGSDYLILEACEYRESFKYLNPDTSIITNIECDHLDYYKDLEDIIIAFQRFAYNSKSIVIDPKYNICHDNIINISNYSIANLQFISDAYSYDVYYQGQFFIHVHLNMLGRHNVINSLFAIATACQYNINKETIMVALANFAGVERRYEKIGYIEDVPIIIDYAHHPTEISSSISGIHEHYKTPLIIFQPHTYTRTIKLFASFIDVLSKIDNLILYPTYPARESEIIGGRALDLFDALSAPCKYITALDDLMGEIKIMLRKEKIDCVLVLGAGDLADNMKKLLKIDI